jgi:hypothetical protein
VLTHSLTRVLAVVELAEFPQEETQVAHLMAVLGCSSHNLLRMVLLLVGLAAAAAAASTTKP